MAAEPPITLAGLRLPLGAPPQRLRALAASKLGLPESQIIEVRPVKVSIDARAKPPAKVYQVRVWTAGADVPDADLPTPSLPASLRPLRVGSAPIIVGTGPAGLWAALRFVEAGQPCILLDRGPEVERRNQAVKVLRTQGELDPESNLCFGEGGAGTYSDGKLYTRVKHPAVRRIYEDLVAFGAPAEILVEAHPHVGTNVLIKLLRRLRAHLQEAGCELRFGARVTDLLVAEGGPACAGVRLASGEEITGSCVVLATGHSARDVYELLQRHGVPLERKPFAVGARCEHPQELIDRIQYGPHAGHPELGAAPYALTAKVGARGVYSFCMCPGGFVIPTPTEVGHLNVNGMSNSNRGSRWANSALVVQVEPEDFYLERPGDLDHHGPLAGIALQRHLERAAYEAGGGGYRAPAMRLTDFRDQRAGDLPARTSYRPGIAAADLYAVLPPRVTGPIARALTRFDQRMRGFLTREAVLIGVETTTSSPVRVGRDDATLMTPGMPGLFPCGEGAGRSGGIVSSAIEGLEVAEAALAIV